MGLDEVGGLEVWEEFLVPLVSASCKATNALQF